MSSLPGGSHIYAFEAKNQLDKLLRFLEIFQLYPWEPKHAAIACHLGKRWIFKEVERVRQASRG